MKIVGTILIWVVFGLLVLALALWVRRRLRRGDRVLLHGRFAPWLVRMVAITIVGFGWKPAQAAEPEPATCAPPAAGMGASPKDALEPPPSLLTPPLLETYTMRGDELIASQFQRLGTLAARRDLSVAELEQLSRALDDLDQQARRNEAFMATQAELGPVTFRPWMGKSMRPNYQHVDKLPGGWDAVYAKKLAVADGAAWSHEAVVDLRVERGTGTLKRYGSHPLSKNINVRLRRFDVVVAGSEGLTLSHPLLGSVVIPAGAPLTAWNLPGYLEAAANAKIDALVARAATCEPTAQAALVRILPAAHVALRAANKPTLQLLLALFDE